MNLPGQKAPHLSPYWNFETIKGCATIVPMLAMLDDDVSDKQTLSRDQKSTPVSFARCIGNQSGYSARRVTFPRPSVPLLCVRPDT